MINCWFENNRSFVIVLVEFNINFFYYDWWKNNLYVVVGFLKF